LQIDPWNRLEASKGDRESETDYVGRCLRELYNLANDFNVHIQIIAHPAKMEGFRRGTAPDLEDVSGSKNWQNMVDQGFVIHRPKLFDEEGNRETYAEFQHQKVRFDELGYATKFGLEYDVEMGRFYSCPLRHKHRKKKDEGNDGGGAD
jgi:twinkle protein